MKKLLSFAASAALLLGAGLAAGSCSGGSSSSPEGVTQAAMSALVDGDIDAFFALADPEEFDADDIADLKDSFKSDFKSLKKTSRGITSPGRLPMST